MHASFPPFTRPASAAPVPAISDTEAKLRTALAHVNHARDLLREALGDVIVPEAGYLPAEAADLARFARDDEATGL